LLLKQFHKMVLLQQDLTEQLIKTFFDVYNELGYGFLEKVYQNSMFIELESRGFDVQAQKLIKVYYKGNRVGEYFADLVVNDLVILELKAAESLNKEFEAQLINYLRSTSMEVGLLFNFGKKPEFIRKVYANTRKINSE